MAQITQKARDLARELDPAGRDFGSAELETLSLLLRHGATYHRYCELECSEEWFANSPEWQRRMERLAERMTELAKDLPPGYQFELGGDPRGHCSYILPPDKRSPDWGGRGYGLSGGQ